MKWHSAPLSKVAPASSSKVSSKQLGEEAWSLTLDQIESNTGRIVNKKVCSPSTAGASTYVFDEGNVLYSKLRPYLNKVVCPDEKGIATTELVPLRPRLSILNRGYLTYYLRSRDFVAFAAQAVAGMKMPRIIMSKFWAHEIPLPPPSEQRKIVELLDQADALRERRAAADKKSERILPALFYKMFGDPATNPRGWDVVELRQLGTPLSGGAFPLNEQGDDDGEIPFIKVSDMNTPGNEVFIKASNNWVSRETLMRLRVRAAPAGTTIFPKIGAAVATNKKRLLVRETAYDNNVMGIIPADPTHSRYIFAFFLLFDLRQLTRTTAVPSIKTSELAVLRIPKPEDSAIRSFDRAFGRILDLQEATLKSCVQIDKLFGTMLHRAFTGDLTAQWREAHMKELLREMEIQAKELILTADEQ